MTTLFLLYFSQGLPLGLFTISMPAWFASENVRASEIGYFIGAVSLPWSFKLISGLIVDRYTYMPMGRRRPWILTAQSLVLSTLVIMALMDPTIDQRVLLAALGFVMSLAMAFQDVTVDGMTIDLVPLEERSRANAVMQGGIWIGVAAISIVAGPCLISGGVSLTAFVMLVPIALTTLLVAITRERPGEKLLPWTSGRIAPHNTAVHGQEWALIFKNLTSAFRDRTAIMLAATIVVIGLVRGLLEAGLISFAVNQLGWTSEEYSRFAGVALLISVLFCLLTIGIVSDKLGRRLAVFTAVSGLALATFIMVGASDHWTAPGVLGGYLFTWILLQIILAISLYAWIMDVCGQAVAASQFALFMALSNVAASAGAAISGPALSVGSYMLLFILSGCLYAGATCLVLLAKAKPDRRRL